ncbi:MAG: hypothetical protein ACM3NR_02630 [Methanosarcina sp.]
MKNAIISFVFATGILLASCSTSRDVTIKERDADGTVVKRERHIDDDGVVIKKSKRDRDILNNDGDKDFSLKVRKERKSRDRDRDEPAIVIKKEDR